MHPSIRVTTAVLFLATSSLGFAQDAARSFDVVSIKRNTAAQGRAVPQVSPGRLSIEALTLRDLIGAAFRSSGTEVIIEGPGWIDTDLFQVEARTGDAAPIDMAMLQPPLIERFNLRVRRERRERPIYQLLLVDSRGRLGPQLTRSTCVPPGASAAQTNAGAPDQPVCTPIRVAAGPSMVAEGVTMAELAERLAAFPVINRTVSDGTGLNGRFDFRIQWVPGGPVVDAGAGNGPDLFTALRDQLGLRLERSTAAVDVVVVEGAQRLTEN
jgi:uncharacterized protein (TIGR03435 family)